MFFSALEAPIHYQEKQLQGLEMPLVILHLHHSLVTSLVSLPHNVLSSLSEFSHFLQLECCWIPNLVQSKPEFFLRSCIWRTVSGKLMYISFLSHWTGRPESHLVLWEAGNILHPIKDTTSHVEKIHFPSYLPLALPYVLDKKHTTYLAS